MGSPYAPICWRPSWLEAPPEMRRCFDTPFMKHQRQYAAAADADLASWSAQGDRAAFDQIVMRHGPFAFRVAMRMVANAALAEDVVQEAMVRAWFQSARFDARRALFTTWLYRIVVNLCIDQCRCVHPVPLPEDFDAVDPGAGAEETLMQRQRGAALADALAGLPARQRAALTLVYDEGLSGAQAACVLGVSAKAVERMLARARAALRGKLNPDMV